MKKKSIIIAFLLGVTMMASWGCGGGISSPGSTNTEDLGVSFEINITPIYNGAPTSSVDVFQQICDPGPPVVLEFFADHSASALLTIRAINNNPPIPPANVFIEKYTIEYRRNPDSIGAPPIESDTRFETISFLPLNPPTTSSQSVEQTVELLDLTRKGKYRTDVLSGQFSSGPAFINNYTAVYTFEGQNANGEKFSVVGQTSFQIGSFDYCD